MNNFWAITTFFNPANYSSLLNNYFVFSENLKKQNVNLLTIEMTFNNNKPQIPNSENVIRLNGNSVMWQKERLINYAITQLPNSCTNFAWLDCDIIFQSNDWANQTIEKLKTNNVVQVFKKITYLPKNKDEKNIVLQGVVWQYKIHKNWLQRRKDKDLPFSSPGFGWAAQKSFFENGIYDKNIIGSGDTFLVDCLLDSWDIHGYAKKFNEFMKKDMMEWYNTLRKKPISLSYIPVDILHLWHGNMKNRSYMDRHDIILNYKYDPIKDIELINNVYEWSSNKPEMHNAIKQYFFDRREDD